jgi:hypothetical protein
VAGRSGVLTFEGEIARRGEGPKERRITPMVCDRLGKGGVFPIHSSLSLF